MWIYIYIYIYTFLETYVQFIYVFQLLRIYLLKLMLNFKYYTKIE